MMKIILKGDWDIPIRLPISEKKKNRMPGHFAGRSKEINLLVNDIVRRKSGAILVSGYPGVGKTSLVYKALVNAKEKEKNIIIVLFNATQLKVQAAEEDKFVKIIENIIRRLYTATREVKGLDASLKKQIQRLYRKAVATEATFTEIQQRYWEKSEEVEREKTTKVLITENLIIVIFWIIAIAFQFVLNTRWELLNKLIPLSLAILPCIALFYYKKSRREKHSEKEEKQAEELYKFDKNLGNLEFDLEEIHSEISQSKRKLVYVIDELDKLEDNEVIKILKCFKNLFTLSDALFIFIGGERLYNIETLEEEKQMDQEKTTYRDKAYTYFTSKYFLSRPLWDDLNEFLNEVLSPKGDFNKEEFENFKRSLCFEAKNDFFDLKMCLKNKMTIGENDQLLIEIKESNDDIIQKARFYKALTVLLEKYMSPNYLKWRENETLLRKLFLYAHKIYSSYPGVEFPDPEGDTVYDELIRDFNGFLFRLKAFEIKARTGSKNIKGIPTPIRTYGYKGNIPTCPPTSFNEPTEFEKRFINEFNKYCDYIIALVNSFKIIKNEKEISKENLFNTSTIDELLSQIENWRSSTKAEFRKYYQLYEEITTKNMDYRYMREDIEESTKQIKFTTKSLLNQLHSIVASMLTDMHPELNLQNKNLFQDLSLFSGSAKQIRQRLQNYNHSIIFKRDYSRQILLINNNIKDIEEIGEVIQDNSQTHKIICFIEKPLEIELKGLHLISYETPEILKFSLQEMFKETKKFLINRHKKENI